MAGTLLSIVQEVCRRTAIPVPNAVIGSQDDQVIQLLGLANEIIEDLNLRNCWTQQQFQTTFTSVLGSDQGAIETLSPGFLYMIQETFWDRTRRLPFVGPLNPAQWQELQALPATNPLYAFRIFQGHIHVWPTLEAGHTCAYEYMSTTAITSSDGLTPKTTFTADSDIFILDQMLLIRGLRYRWKAEKGLPYTVEMQSYMTAAIQLAGADGPKRRLSMNEADNPGMVPGVWISPGSWPLSNP